MTNLHPVFSEILSAVVAPSAAPAPVSRRQAVITEAIDNADAHLNNVGIPNYSDLVAIAKRAVRHLSDVVDSLPAADRRINAELRMQLVDVIKAADPAYYGFTA